MGKLKPCPFCGRTPRLTTYAEDDLAWSQALIKCENCGAYCHKAHRSAEQAIAWWNSRALDPVDTHLVKNLGKWAMLNEKAKIDWDAVDDAFDNFLEGFHDVEGERYERRAARNGGEWMKHLIRQAMKTPNTDFNLTTTGNDMCTRPAITDCHAKIGTGGKCMNGIRCPPLQVKS